MLVEVCTYADCERASISRKGTRVECSGIVTVGFGVQCTAVKQGISQVRMERAVVPRVETRSLRKENRSERRS